MAEVRAINDGDKDSSPADVIIDLPVLETEDLLIAFVTWGGPQDPPTAPAGWTTLAFGEFGTTVATWIGYRFVDGTEGYVGDGSDTVVLDVPSTGQATYISMSILDTGAETRNPTKSGPSGSHTINPNPPTVAFDESDSKQMVIAYLGRTNTTRSITVWPVDYDENQHQKGNSFNINGSVTAVATRLVEGSSEDPGPFTLNLSDNTAVVTVAVPDVPAISGYQGFGAVNI